MPHFCQLELGDLTDESSLLRHCHERQLDVMHQLPDLPIRAEQLPSLTVFETSLRSTNANRATGLDPIPSGLHHEHAPTISKLYYALLLKIYVWCAEPLSFKGGVMCLLHKKGSTAEIANYRGILLLGSIAKRIHGIMRQTLMTTLTPHRAEGQLGGFANQLVQFGFHSVTTWTHILETKGFSTAVVYIDLASAFHHLLRETVLGSAASADFEQILRKLSEAGHATEAWAHGQVLVGSLAQMGCDARILQLLRDIHQDTWLTLSKGEIIRTTRGTRPGSPLADAIFHVAMAHIMAGVRDWIGHQEEFTTLLHAFDMPVLTAIWADDVAIPWATSEATALVPAVCRLVQHLDHAFADKGFQINYDLHKTHVVITFQGPGAPSLRKEYLHQARPGVSCDLMSKGAVWLHFRPTYKHLGFMYAASQSLDVEIRHRIGQARQAFTQMSKAILTNRHLPEHIRLRLFKVLIETKLFYGLGSWRTPSLKQMHTLRVAYLSLLRKVLRLPHDSHCTNGHFCQSWHV